MSLLDHLYWVTGTAIGVLAGSVITFDTAGMDFALTALFVVIFVDQWKSGKGHKAALVGILSSAACVLFLGQDVFIIPAMILILTIITGILCAGNQGKSWMYKRCFAGPFIRKKKKGGKIMSQDMTKYILIVGAMMLATVITRFLPFILFRQGRKPQVYRLFRSQFLPYATIGLLVVYCLRGLQFASYPHGLPELISIGAIVALHLWK